MKTTILFCILTFSFLTGHSAGGEDDKIALEKLFSEKQKKAKELSVTSIDSALLLSQDLFNLAKKIGDKAVVSYYLLNSRLHQSKGNYGITLEQLDLIDKTINESKTLTQKEIIQGKIKTFLSRGSLEMNQGKYAESLEHYLNSATLCKEKNDSSLLAQSYSKIGLVNYYLYKDSLALDYYNKALAIHESLDEKDGISIITFNIGNLLQEGGNYDAAIENYLISLETEKELNNMEGQAFAYNNIAQAYIIQKKYREALPFNNKNLDLSRKLGKVKNILFALTNGAEISFALDDNESALEKANEAKELAQSTNDIEILSDVYKFLSKLEESIGKFDASLEHFKLFHQLRDSIFNQEKEKIFIETEAKYLSQEKQKEIEIKDQNLKQKDEEITNIIREENFTFILFIIFISVSALISLIIYFNYRKKKKLTDELEKLSIVAQEIENTVIIANKAGKIQWVNASYSRKTGFGLEELKNKFGKYISNETDHPEIQEIVKQSKQDKKPKKYSMCLEKKSGEKHWVQTTLTPILDEHGEIKNFVLIDADITDVKLAEAKVAMHRDELVIKNNMITESIDYANRIQSALLPSRQKMQDIFEDHFIYFQPKDIVSGDFYWTKQLENETFFAAADCTGHGVPGALISIIGMNALNNIIKSGITQVDLILEELSDIILETLTHQDHAEQLKDGIDISLCNFRKEITDTQIGVLEFAGAHNPLYLVRNNELSEIKGDKIHIGANRREGKSFTKHSFPLMKGDVIYLFSDGYVDQKGGKDGKKYYYTPFRELLLKNHYLPMDQQKIILNDTMASWKEGMEQLDDILIMGMKF